MKKFGVFLAIILTVSATAVSSVVAMPDMNIVTANCQATQSTLQRLAKVDVSARLNRGGDYDKLLKLMFAMNARLATNHIAAPKLSEITERYEKSIAEFRRDYDVYDEDLSYLSKIISCSTKPSEFYSSLEKTRFSRAILHNDVVELDQLTDEYTTFLNETVENIL
ncbi:MAG: hypothetical protein LBM09_03160 [Candidatus Nomurabacteria bacterium]|jgi:hypothetical protein|nr:hypothetical protein [Candidatus Nomurabacteria bacterium]